MSTVAHAQDVLDLVQRENLGFRADPRPVARTRDQPMTTTHG
jgi:hypothetical protein